MNETLKVIVGEWLRKLIVGACAVGITWLATQGIATEAELSRIIEITVMSAIALGSLLWSRVIWPWIQAKMAK